MKKIFNGKKRKILPKKGGRFKAAPKQQVSIERQEVQELIERQDTDKDLSVKNSILPGALYIVSTPIGNLSDMTPRARFVLENVDVILSEDTRVTQKLFSALKTKPKGVFLRWDQRTEQANCLKILEKLRNNESIALVSDAGTPGVSDPGGLLVQAALNESFKVIPVVGASAFVAHMSVCGFRVRSFCFLGFFPRTHKELQAELEKISQINAIEPTAFFWFESPKRILKTLKELKCYFKEAQINVLKEATKKFEKIFYGALSDVALQVENEIQSEGERGEWSLALLPSQSIFKDNSPSKNTEKTWEDMTKMLIESGVSVSLASKQISQYFQVSKKDVYASALRYASKKT